MLFLWLRGSWQISRQELSYRLHHRGDIQFIIPIKGISVKVSERNCSGFTLQRFQNRPEMKANLKTYSPTVDYCAFMVAIVVICHSVDVVNTNYQWSAEEIAEILNSLPRAMHPNYHLNPVALKQGLLLFKRHLSKWGITAIEMYQDEKKSLEFFDLGESRRSIEIKFGTHRSLSEQKSDSETLEEILNVRNRLLMLGGYEKSIHGTPCSVFGTLYLPLAINPTPIKDSQKSPPTDVSHASTNNSQFMTKQYKVRKSPNRLGSKAIYNSTKKVLFSAVESFGDKHALFYLESAVKKLRKRNRSDFEEYEVNKFEEESGEESDEDINVINLEDEDRIVEAASNFAVKYITFTEDDKREILALFQVVLEVARERQLKKCERLAAITTASLLKENVYYSNLSPRTITRWYEVNDKNKKTRGPKLTEVFEKEVWGKLMLTVFEKVTNI